MTIIYHFIIIAAMTAIYAKLIRTKQPTPELTEESSSDASESELVSLHEAQRILGVSRTTVWRLRKKGVINSNRDSRIVKISRQELFNHLNNKHEDNLSR
jgi:hypothetical protein